MKFALRLALPVVAAASLCGCSKTPGADSAAPAKVPLKVSDGAPAKPTFTSDKYGFALYLPSQPTQQQKPMPAEMGGATMDLFVVPPAPVAYTIVPLMIPASAAEMDEGKFYDGVEAGLLSSTNGQRLGSRDIEVNGQKTREVKTTFSTPTPDSTTPVKYIALTRIYRVGKRSIQFAAIAPESQTKANQAQIDKVLNSVVISP